MECKYCDHQPERNHHLAGYCLEESTQKAKCINIECKYCKKVVNYDNQSQRNHHLAGYTTVDVYIPNHREEQLNIHIQRDMYINKT